MFQKITGLVEMLSVLDGPIDSRAGYNQILGGANEILIRTI